MNKFTERASRDTDMWLVLAREIEDREMLEMAGVIERPFCNPDDLWME